MRNTMTVTVMFALAATVACGGAPMAGPSPMVEAPPTGMTAAAFPAGLDPAYVRALAAVDEQDHPRRWEGGPFHHCIAPGVDVERVRRVAAEMTRITGIPQTEEGPCNVTWDMATMSPKLKAYTTIVNTTPIRIIRAEVHFNGEYNQRNATHESGHVLGLADAQNGAMGNADAFSADELAVLAWMYGR